MTPRDYKSAGLSEQEVQLIQTPVSRWPKEGGFKMLSATCMAALDKYFNYMFLLKKKSEDETKGFTIKERHEYEKEQAQKAQAKKHHGSATLKPSLPSA